MTKIKEKKKSKRKNTSDEEVIEKSECSVDETDISKVKEEKMNSDEIVSKTNKKKKSKKKIASDEKIIEKARRFVDEPENNDVDNQEMDLEKRKMKEIKREKMRLKRQKKKEEKLKQYCKRETEDFAKSAISYLHLWNNNRHAWTFKKNLQIWLLNHIYDEQKLKDEDFQIMLLYMLDSKGAMRQRTVEQAESIISSWDNRPDDDDVNVQVECSIKVLDKITQQSYQRARDIVQTLV